VRDATCFQCRQSSRCRSRPVETRLNSSSTLEGPRELTKPLLTSCRKVR
jgi:hypothetical protein